MPHVIVHEVGLRDGLQSVKQVMATVDKLHWIDAEYEAGVRFMEVASFVPPKLLPQMADAALVVAHALTKPGLEVTALAPNVRGAEAAIAAGVHCITMPISVSAAHSMANVRKTPAQAAMEFAKVRGQIDASGQRILLAAGLSTVFGCTYQGAVAVTDVLDIVRRVIDAGCDMITLADTTGYATPAQVKHVIRSVQTIAPSMRLIGHFHDTRRMALPNTLVALECGIVEFDASLGGLGGCPFAAGATGNVATEDLVYLLESMGHDTSIDLLGLISIRGLLNSALKEEHLVEGIGKVGPPTNFLKADAARAAFHLE